MPYSEDFELPYAEQAPSVMPEKEAAKSAFYAAGSYSNNPVEDYNKIYTELSQSGNSELFSVAKNRWIKEQDLSNRVVVAEAINDPTLSIQQKKELVANYSSGRGVSDSLKDKYVERVASVQNHITQIEKQQQDANVRAIQQKETKVKQQARTNVDKTFFQDAKDVSVGLGVTALDFIQAAGAGIGGAYVAVKEWDTMKGREFMGELMNDWRTGALPKDQEKVRNWISNKAAYLGVPMEYIQEKLVSVGVPIRTAIPLSFALDPTAWLLGGTTRFGVAVTKAGARRVTNSIKNLVKIDPDSPATTTSIANPKMSADLLAGALEDSSDNTAKSLGITKGEAIADAVLPNDVRGGDINVHPDLRSRIISKVNREEAEFSGVMEELRFDPNIQNADAMIADKNLVLDTIKEVRDLHYHQNKSAVENVVGNLYEGNAIFGPSEGLAFGSRKAAISSYDRLRSLVETLPESMRGEISIVDALTNKRYSPETIMKEEAFMSREELQPVLSKYKRKEDNPEFAANQTKATELENQALALDKKVKEANAIKDTAARDVLAEEVRNLRIEARRLREANERIIAEDVPPELKAKLNYAGSTPPKQFFVEWRWKKEYDPINPFIFGEDAISARLGFGKLSVDVSGLEKTGLEGWILNPNTLPKNYQQAVARLGPRAAKASNFILNKIKNDIVSGGLKKEVASLIEAGLQTGKEEFSLKELGAMFTHLKQPQLEKLLQKHIAVRSVIRWTHQLINYQKRDSYYANNFTRGLKVDGEFKHAINDHIVFDDVTLKKPATVWDFDLEKEVFLEIDGEKLLDPTTKRRATFATNGKRVVQLAEPIEKADGHFRYALVEGERTTIDLLPDVVVRKVDGYFPRSYKEHFFIDVTPTIAKIDGFPTGDRTVLATLANTVAAASSKAEAEALKAEFMAKYPASKFDVSIRAARENDFGTLLKDYELHGSSLNHAKKRGEHLPSANNTLAKLEDPLLTLNKTVSELTRSGAMAHFDREFEKAFVRDYGEFLDSPELPTNVMGIKLKGTVSIESKAKYDTAIAVYNKYARLKAFDTTSGRAVSGFLNTVADVLEDFKILPGNLKVASKIRDAAGNTENSLSLPRKVASTLYISFFPQRQYIVQLQTFVELAAMYPFSAPKMLMQTIALRTALLADSNVYSGKLGAGALLKGAKTAAIGMNEAEFNATLKAIKQAGLLEQIDLNLMVHGLFNELDTPLKETRMQAAGRISKTIATAPAKISKTVGYDNAEALNRIGLFLVAKENWRRRNPGKDWTTRTAVEEIAADEYYLSGSMSRENAFKYQSGFWSNFFQFSAASHKVTMNIFQEGSTSLSTSQRLRLGITRSILFGGRHGLPLGEILFDYINTIEDEKARQQLMKLAPGLIDNVVNNVIEMSTNEKAELDISGTVSPNLKYVHPALEIFIKYLRNEQGGPKFPVQSAFGSLYDTAKTLYHMFEVKDLDKDSAMAAANTIAKLATGWSAISKSYADRALKDKETKLGIKFGLNLTGPEIAAEAFGIKTQRQQYVMDGINSAQKAEQLFKSLGADLYNTMLVLEKEYPNDDNIMTMNRLINALDSEELGENGKQAVLLEMIRLDNERYSGTLVDSLFMKLYRSNASTKSADFRAALNDLEQVAKASNEPGLLDFVNTIKGIK
jgi:hypothetical protein